MTTTAVPKPLPDPPHVPIVGPDGEMSRQWIEYLKSLDAAVRTLCGKV